MHCFKWSYLQFLMSKSNLKASDVYSVVEQTPGASIRLHSCASVLWLGWEFDEAHEARQIGSRHFQGFVCAFTRTHNISINPVLPSRDVH
jgi:hypothetical protein